MNPVILLKIIYTWYLKISSPETLLSKLSSTSQTNYCAKILFKSFPFVSAALVSSPNLIFSRPWTS